MRKCALAAFTTPRATPQPASPAVLAKLSTDGGAALDAPTLQILLLVQANSRSFAPFVPEPKNGNTDRTLLSVAPVIPVHHSLYPRRIRAPFSPPIMLKRTGQSNSGNA